MKIMELAATTIFGVLALFAFLIIEVLPWLVLLTIILSPFLLFLL